MHIITPHALPMGSEAMPTPSADLAAWMQARRHRRSIQCSHRRSRRLPLRRASSGPDGNTPRQAGRAPRARATNARYTRARDTNIAMNLPKSGSCASARLGQQSIEQGHELLIRIIHAQLPHGLPHLGQWVGAWIASLKP